MKIKVMIILIGLVALILVVFHKSFFLSKEERLTKKNIQKYEIPIYSLSKNVEYFTKNKGLVKGVTYDVGIYYPADNLIDFYKDRMKSGNFIVESIGNTKQWNSYEDSTLRGSPMVYAFVLSWIDSNKTKEITLILNYYVKNLDKPLILQQLKDLKCSVWVKPYYGE